MSKEQVRTGERAKGGHVEETLNQLIPEVDTSIVASIPTSLLMIPLTLSMRRVTGKREKFGGREKRGDYRGTGRAAVDQVAT